MKIKHWIIVRFFSEILGKFMLKDILSDGMLGMGLDLLQDNLLPSLNNQSCKDFELVLLVHDQLDDNSKWIAQLKNLQADCDFKLRVIHASQLAQTIEIQGEDKRIISRVDYDDLISDQVVADIQTFARLHQKKPFSVYGYNYGWVWRDDTCQLYELDKNYKVFGGHFSAMQSVVLDCSRALKIFHKVHPYLWDHSSVVSYINSLPRDLAEREVELKHNLNLRAYVWMRHKNTGSVDPYRLKADRIQQVVDKHIIEVLDFETHFGKKLEVKV